MPIRKYCGYRKEKNIIQETMKEIVRISNLDQIDLTKGKWLILTRTVSRLLKIEEELIKKIYILKVTEEKASGSGI